MIWRRFEIVSAINLDIQLISNTWLYKQIKIMQLNPYMRVPFLFHYCKSHIFMKMKKFNDNFCISNRNNLHRRCQDVVQHSNEKKRKKEKWKVCQIQKMKEKSELCTMISEIISFPLLACSTFLVDAVKVDHRLYLYIHFSQYFLKALI